MKIKVCGMKECENIKQLALLDIDFMGFIFYNKSPRFIQNLDPNEIQKLPTSINKVGVFVNADLSQIINKVASFRLDYIQLHGNESVGYIKTIKEILPNQKIIKAFSLSSIKDLDQTKKYTPYCNFFLFDTKTPNYGGSGEKFNWKILQQYTEEIPFFLSGGISEEDAKDIKEINHNKLYGIDLNSKFELKPGIKNTAQLQAFIKEIKTTSDEQNK